MKFSISTISIVGALLAISFSCNKDINLLEELEPVQPASADANAGTWRFIVLSSPTQIVVPPPTATNSDAYRAELEAVKNAQRKLTEQQREIIAYWSAGGVLRWNQILRGLVARFNLAPSPLTDGTYPIPDPESPFGNPEFPFANPPYSARAYSYVSAAQYDALKVAWAYKFQYNRPTPASVDPAIQLLVPVTNLPAYPSEEAVMSGVTAEMLKALFPAAVQEITLKAAEQRNAAIWSGKATASDVAAGLALGKSVAGVFTTRAASDGMRTAIGTPAQWKLLEDNTVARGEIPWKSLDVPARPPMLPFFGLRDIGGTAVGVRCWNLTSAELVAERPAAPPSTSSLEMQEDLDEVKFYADNLTRERLAIVHKWADGAGTYTPPGHWNDIAAEYIHRARMSEVRAARAFALLNMSLHDAAVACWEAKYFYYNPRPSQLNPAIKTATGVPNFPSFTSGHSTFSGAAAHVLSYLFPSDRSFFESQATEASLSRLYGGIHYRVDCEVGLQHGKRVAQYTINFAQQDGAN
jgi:hypothetical protein